MTTKKRRRGDAFIRRALAGAYLQGHTDNGAVEVIPGQAIVDALPAECMHISRNEPDERVTSRWRNQ